MVSCDLNSSSSIKNRYNFSCKVNQDHRLHLVYLMAKQYLHAYRLRICMQRAVKHLYKTLRYLNSSLGDHMDLKL